MANTDNQQIALTAARHLNMVPSHVGAFLLLMFLSTFRLESIAQVSLSLATVTVVTLTTLLVVKLHYTIGIIGYLRRYRFELAFFSLFILACIISTWLNIDRYKTAADIFKYAITPITVYCAFFGVMTLFMLPQNQRGPSLSRYSFAGFLPWLYFT